MLVSYKWLQKYFKENLPTPQEVADAFTFHAFDIEGMSEGEEGDTIFDVKVLPDRANYALSHRGIAKELSAILDIQIISQEENKEGLSINNGIKPPKIIIEATEACSRYVGRRIENIKVEDSPEWLKQKLHAVGQRSINSIVDAANYVMLDSGQPLHAFDADKIAGSIVVRFAKEGEALTTLDNKEIKLDSSMLIIADDQEPLGIAGIKGGKKAEVTRETKNLIIEAANFNPSFIRKTSTKINIKSDASKRFENGITDEFAVVGMNEVSSLISELNFEAKIGDIVDIYKEAKNPITILISVDYINSLLGVDISKDEITSIIEKIKILVEEKDDKLSLTIPAERLDLVIPQNIVEEVGRLYGYEKIPAKLASFIKKKENTFIKRDRLYWIEKIKKILVGMEFSEVFTSSLASKGFFEIEKSASDKNFLRSNLSDNIQKSLDMNLYNAPLLGLDQIKIFEIGKVFPEDGEHTALCMGIANTKNHKGDKANEEIKKAKENLFQILGAKLNTVCTIDDAGGIIIIQGKQIGKINNIEGVLELNLDELINHIPQGETDEKEEENKTEDTEGNVSQIKKYEPISSYPFVLRDLAVFVPVSVSVDQSGTDEKNNEVEGIIKSEGTDLLVRADIFDTFTKNFKETGETKTSYAYRLVFQAFDRTLTDDEVNGIMERITAKLNSKVGWQVR